ncbi:O-antigen ligase family protein [Patescibacteria group bacterium]
MKIEKVSTKKLLAWLDKNLLTYLAGFLLVFIPLYPKLPLFDAIPGYIVRVRFEDFLILFTMIVWLVQVFRKKVEWKNPLFYIIIAYIGFGFLTTLSAIFITKTVPNELIHVGKMYLHYFRNIEYFSLFFILYSAVKTKKQARILVTLSSVVMLLVSIYGYGQRYLYWPVYSTMNREFAKGLRLYLTEHARVPSTFGGHYDLAAYTMVVLTFILSLFYFVKNKWLKLLFAASYAAGFWLLILTASRTSFIAYLVSITTLFFIFLFVKGWKWSIPRWFLVMFLSMFVMLSFGDLSERFTQVLGLKKIKEKYSNLAFLPKAEKPENAVSIDEISKVTVSSDAPPSQTKPTNLPGDVYEDIPLPVEDGKGGVKLVTRTYSENAYKYGLSAAIRFDALWPRAIAGFKKNPLLGAGYSTLTKTSNIQFTEAESTDNNFLRTLGETGLLGFITFYGTIIAAFYFTVKKLKDLKKDPLLHAYAIGMLAAIIGLLLNASYIDVFAASKVAETFWAYVGLLMAITYGIKTKSKKAKQTKKK